MKVPDLSHLKQMDLTNSRAEPRETVEMHAYHVFLLVFKSFDHA